MKKWALPLIALAAIALFFLRRGVTVRPTASPGALLGGGGTSGGGGSASLINPALRASAPGLLSTLLPGIASLFAGSGTKALGNGNSFIPKSAVGPSAQSGDNPNSTAQDVGAGLDEFGQGDTSGFATGYAGDSTSFGGSAADFGGDVQPPPPVFIGGGGGGSGGEFSGDGFGVGTIDPQPFDAGGGEFDG